MNNPCDDILAQVRKRHQAVDLQPTARVELVGFHIDTHLFALPICDVKEIVAVDRIFMVPGADRVFSGVINVHGAIEAVLNLNQFLELGLANHKPSKAIIAESGTTRTAISIDRIEDIFDVPELSVGPIPDTLHGRVRGFLTGQLKEGQQTILVLNLDQIIKEIKQDG